MFDNARIIVDESFTRCTAHLLVHLVGNAKYMLNPLERGTMPDSNL